MFYYQSSNWNKGIGVVGASVVNEAVYISDDDEWDDLRGVSWIRYTRWKWRGEFYLDFDQWRNENHVPLWFITLSFAVLPALWLILRYRHLRNRDKRLPNHCRQCGYDLTGTLAAGRSECPECGAAVQAKEAAT